MIFKQLKLENFKSHKDTTINFTEGITMIIGENGAGKSSIFEAISFALYKKVKNSLSSLVFSQPNKDKKNVMSVSLTFQHNGKEYKVIRKKNKTNSIAKLYLQDGEDESSVLISEGDSNVTKEIENILQMDSDLFSNSAYIKQGEIDDLVNKTPGKRKQIIGKLLNIQDLEKAALNMTFVRNHYVNKVAELKGLSSSHENDKLELKKQRRETLSLKNDSINITNRLKDLKREKEENEKELKKIENCKSEDERLTLLLSEKITQKSELKERINSIKKDIEEINQSKIELDEIGHESNELDVYLEYRDLINEKNKLLKLKKEIDAETKNIKKFKNDHDDFLKIKEEVSDLNDLSFSKMMALEVLQSKVKNFKNIENELLTLQKTLSKIDDSYTIDDVISKINDLEKDIKEYQDKRLDYEFESRSLDNKIESIRESKRNLKRVDKKCPICNSIIDKQKKDSIEKEYDKQIDELKSEYDQISEKLISIFNTETELENQLKKYKNKLIELDNAKNLRNKEKSLLDEMKEFEKLLNEYDILKSENDKILAYIDSKKNKLEDLKSSYESYNKSKIILDSIDKSSLDDLKIVEEKIENTQNENSYLTNITDNIDDIIIKLKKENDRRIELKAIISSNRNLDSDLSTNKNKLLDIEDNIEQLNKLKREISYDSNRHMNLTSLKNTFDNQVFDLNNQLQRINGTISANENHIKLLENKINKNKNIKIKIKEIQDFIILIDDIKYKFGKDGIQKTLRELFKPIIEDNTRNIFDKFDFNYSNLTLNEDYEISIYSNQQKINIDMVSGGEKIAIALALRFGITQSISQGRVESILLDEPTIYLDNYRKNELINILKNLNLLPQMIIVTHEDSLKSCANNIIKISKKNGVSKVVK